MKKVFRKPGTSSPRGRKTYTKGEWPVTPVSAVLPKGAKVVGPFPANVTPSKPGPFRRERDGHNYWSFWNGKTWGLMGKNLPRAIKRKDKPSGIQTGCRWYGISKSA